jgi:hypothetical protein
MSRNEILGVLIALIAATGVIVWGTAFFVNHYLLPPNFNDPLAMQGGLRPDQNGGR